MGTIFGTITGVVAEFQLLEEANNSVAEATGKLTEMEAKGEQGTTQYSQAQQQLEKAQRFLRFTTRNLALAVTNFIPEILLLVTSLSKAKVAAEAAGPAFKEVGAVSKAVAAETTIANTALNSQAGSFAIMSKNAKAVKPALTDVGLAADGVGVAVAKSGNIFTKFIGIITNKWFIVLAAASAALLAFVENWGGFRDIVNQAGVALGNFAPILKGILEPMGKFGDWLAETLGNKAKTGTDEAKKGFKGLSKEAVKAAEDVQKAWEETLDNLVEMTKKERLKYLKDLGFGKEGA